ncbi:MAG: substrate-binding domain-containing protein [Anaerolineae bacterium]
MNGRTRLYAALLFAGAVTAAGLAACAPAAAPSTSPAATRTVTVFAAASLTEPFGEIARGFEAANPGVRVALSFAGSQQLATQILEGAPADVFAAANGRRWRASWRRARR